MHGIVGTVTKHPLDNWGKFKDFKMPNPMTHMGIGAINWDEYKKRLHI